MKPELKPTSTGLSAGEREPTSMLEMTSEDASSVTPRMLFPHSKPDVVFDEAGTLPLAVVAPIVKALRAKGTATFMVTTAAPQRRSREQTRHLARSAMERIAAQVAEGYAAVNRWPAFYKATIRNLPAGDVVRIFAAASGDQLDQGDIARLWRELDHGEFVVTFTGNSGERHAVVRIRNGKVDDMTTATAEQLLEALSIAEAMPGQPH